MFVDEARTVAKIRHPNVVQTQELGQEGDEVFLVMEYVEGENLSGLLKRLTLRSEELDVGLAAHIVAEACAGLHAAHELTDEHGHALDLVHRDVSPQNVIVTYDGHVKVLDFGIATTADKTRHTEVGVVKGKIEYMSPEQCRAETLDRRSDLFSLGIVLYELATGRRLYQRGGQLHCMRAICDEPLVPPSRVKHGLPRELDEVCARALEKAKADRYPNAAEMRKDLAAVAHGHGPVEPTEALGALMQRLFPDRVEEKKELLKRVAESAPVTHVPPGEVDDVVVVPDVPATSGKTGRTLPVLGLVVPALLVLVLLGVGLAFASRRGQAAPSVEAPAPSAPAPPAEVVVHVESTPPGARVVVDGEERGDTPLDLRLPRRDAPRSLELRLDGFDPLAQTLVADADQRLVIALKPASAAPDAGPTRGRRPPKPRPSASGFRRFD
jgi:serine/threonine-protein kinase